VSTGSPAPSPTACAGPRQQSPTLPRAFCAGARRAGAPGTSDRHPVYPGVQGGTVGATTVAGWERVGRQARPTTQPHRKWAVSRSGTQPLLRPSEPRRGRETVHRPRHGGAHACKHPAPSLRLTSASTLASLYDDTAVPEPPSAYGPGTLMGDIWVWGTPRGPAASSSLDSPSPMSSSSAILWWPPLVTALPVGKLFPVGNGTASGSGRGAGCGRGAGPAGLLHPKRRQRTSDKRAGAAAGAGAGVLEQRGSAAGRPGGCVGGGGGGGCAPFHLPLLNAWGTHSRLYVKDVVRRVFPLQY
jgi:hypothetical protein